MYNCLHLWGKNLLAQSCTRGPAQGCQSRFHLPCTQSGKQASEYTEVWKYLWSVLVVMWWSDGHLITEEVAPVAGGNHHWLAESGLGPGCSVSWVWPGEGLVTVELCLVSCLLVRVVLQPQAATPPAPSSPLVRGAQLPRHLGLSWGEH